ncbi:MAG: 3-dehydroquinate synthase, partial [Clostridia bacterium]|nr:3-dehydroquinate synthase [Clostridia bacterium]
MTISISLAHAQYDIVLQKGALAQVGEHFDLNRKICIVTDSGVPSQYVKAVAAACKESFVFSFETGEKSKSLATYEALCEFLLENQFSRSDAIVAVGGGVVGDLAGFAAATYMRGIDFYNVPTTLLSQLDSSIGGKVAVNFSGVKNVLGAFYHPKKVLIDPAVLSTLPKRHVSNGLAEAIKMAATSDKELFALLETEPFAENLEEIIARSLSIKKNIVEKDEKETNLRRILNFGHTIGHGIESKADLYHGECVALGMLPMCAPAVRTRLEKVLAKLSLPVRVC